MPKLSLHRKLDAALYAVPAPMSRRAAAIIIATRMLACLASLAQDQIIGMRIDFAYTIDDNGLWVRLFVITHATEDSLAVWTNQVENVRTPKMQVDCPQDAVIALATYSVYSNRVSDEYKLYSSKISYRYLRVQLLCGRNPFVPARWQGHTRRR